MAKAKPTSLSILTLLTEDLLLKILNKLAHDSDIKAWRLVCTEFHRVESLHRRSLRLRRPEWFPILVRRYGFLHRLDLSVCPRLTNRMLTLLFAEPGWARNLRALVLTRATGVRFGGLEAAVRACPRLEEVDVSHCWGFGDREAAAISCAGGLRVLKMEKCLGVTDVGLAKIAVGCSRLQNLNLKLCLEISDLGIDLLSKKCADLTVLDLSYLKITNKSLHSISSLQKLESLLMIGCASIDDNGLNYLAEGNPSLQSIEMSRCNRMTSCGLISVIKGHNGLRQIIAGHSFSELSAPLVQNLKDLKSLRLLNFESLGISVSILQMIGIHCKNLVEIGLSKCTGVTDEGILAIVSNRLKTIDLTCCDSITDGAILAIADSCKNLLCLKLESCTLITEAGLDRLATCCTFLQELDLTDCDINDTGLKHLSRCSELVDLKLGFCQSISDKGLTHIGSNCRKLQELDLYRCTGVGDVGLASISNGCRKLRKLNICYCKQITDDGLMHLSSLGELMDLEIRNLVKITCKGLAALVIGCANLALLDLKACISVDDVGFMALAKHARNLRQINISSCSISDVGLNVMLGSSSCLQDVKMVHLKCVTMEGLELALRAGMDRLKKVKLLSNLKERLSPELARFLQARGCRIRWVAKPWIFL